MKSNRQHSRAPRASVACSKCRSRKVRCDVSRRGHPCLNCELDNEECVILPRRRMGRLPAALKTPPAVAESPPSKPTPSSTSDDWNEDATTPCDPAAPEISRYTTYPVDIPFQAYGFVKTGFLSRLPQDEICYLDSQSCFRLPIRASWNRLIHAYFRHINPLLPVLDETAFWQEVRHNACSGTLSLFVAQAVLFAACPFADRRAIKGCGFANCRDARAAFYRRAKVSLQSRILPIASSSYITAVVPNGN